MQAHVCTRRVLQLETKLTAQSVHVFRQCMHHMLHLTPQRCHIVTHKVNVQLRELHRRQHRPRLAGSVLEPRRFRQLPLRELAQLVPHEVAKIHFVDLQLLNFIALLRCSRTILTNLQFILANASTYPLAFDIRQSLLIFAARLPGNTPLGTRPTAAYPPREVLVLHFDLLSRSVGGDMSSKRSKSV
jgi:hypothetical protein